METLERHECAICFEEVDPAKTVKLPCKHCYHGPCLQAWADRSTGGAALTCPQCRAPCPQAVFAELRRRGEGI